MANELRTEVEQVKKQEDVKRALKQASPVQPKDEPKAETPKVKAASALPKPVEWSDFLLILMRTLMPFTEAREAVIAAIEAYEGASP